MKKSNFLIGFAILFTFFAPFIFTLKGPEFLDFTEKGEIGDTIAGTTAPIIGLVNAILLYFTLREQYRFNEHQIGISKEEQFKSTFFNLLQEHRDIKQKVESSFSYLDCQDVRKRFDDYHVKGEMFFINASNQISLIFSSLEQKDCYGYSQEDAIDIEDSIEEDVYNDGINGINVPPIEIKEFEKKCSEKRLPFILGYVNQQYCITQSGHLKYNSVNTIQKKIAIAYYFFYRHHCNVSVYFRHLYHILKFVRYSEAQYLRYSSNHSQQADIHKKYREYVQFVQAQMSTAELKLLFYNSFLFPKMQELLIHYGLLENLCIQDLCMKDHNCISAFHLKNKNKEILDVIGNTE